MVEKESLTCLEISHILLKIWFEEIKFFPIIIDILIKFEVFMNSPYEFTDNQDALQFIIVQLD